MTVFNSTQMAKLVAVPVQHIRSDEHGRVRRAYFAWEDATLTPLAADTINLCKLPPGARVMGGQLYWEANAAGATLNIGIAGSAGKYSAVPALLTNVPVIQVNTGGATGGKGGFDLVGAGTGGTNAAPVIGEVQASAVTIVATTAVATLTANKRFCGYMDYLGVE
jgi:hypothetical protein